MGNAVRSIVEGRDFGPSLEFERLPVVGADRRRRADRARAWRVILIGLAVFWIGVTVALIVVALR